MRAVLCDIIGLVCLAGSGALKTREWKTRHQVAGVENAGVDNFSGVFRGRIPSKRSKQRNRIDVAKIHQTHNISCITENKQEIRRGSQADRPARYVALHLLVGLSRLLRMSVIFAYTHHRYSSRPILLIF